MAGASDAALQVIGTATYQGGNFNLVYEDDSIDGGLVWLDFLQLGTWLNDSAWAAGLNTPGVLTYNLDPGVHVTWGGDWRMPVTDESLANPLGGYGYAGPDAGGYHGYYWGHNMVNSELGHLFFISLGNLGDVDTNGQTIGSSFDAGGFFTYLIPTEIWSGTMVGSGTNVWTFYTNLGLQANSLSAYGGSWRSAIAVRPAEVSIVPEIPLLSEWGVFSLILLLGGAAVWTVPRARWHVTAQAGTAFAYPVVGRVSAHRDRRSQGRVTPHSGRPG